MRGQDVGGRVNLESAVGKESETRKVESLLHLRLDARFNHL